MNVVSISWAVFDRFDKPRERGSTLAWSPIETWNAVIEKRLGAEREECFLAAGTFWKPSQRPSSHVMIAAHVMNQRWAMLPFGNHSRRDSRVLLGPLAKRQERRLFIEVNSDTDLDVDLALLLEEADQALAPVLNG